MDIHTTDEATAQKQDSITNFDSVQSIASGEDTMLFSRTPGEVLTRVELDLACFAEKLVNLNILVMHVAMREGDFEAFVSDSDHDLGDNALKALEFDFLSGVLDSEVREMDSFLSTVQSEIVNISEFVSSYDHLEQPLEEIEDKIHDSEESLKQSIYQVSEIKAQSAKFQRILSSSSGLEKEEGNEGAGYRENSDFLGPNEKVKLQTAEQQRHFLTMLEKSLAREMDLEKKVSELKQIDQELKLKLRSSEQEAFFMEEEALLTWQRLFEAENASEVFMGISQETLSRLQHVHFSLNGSTQREEKLRSGLEDLAILSEKTDESEKFVLLEKQLEDYELRLHHALASADATEEKQRLLYDTINDMESIIEDLKSRVSRAETRAEGVEENCIKLSETNSELNEEINRLQSRLECLEGSLQKSEKTKMETAKDIGIRTKVITNLVMQLAFERERLHKQIFSLKKENKLMSQHCHSDRVISKDYLFSKQGYDAADESKEQSGVSTTNFEVEKSIDNKFGGERETKLETVRNIDARQINYKYVFMAALVLTFSALAGFWANQSQV